MKLKFFTLCGVLFVLGGCVAAGGSAGSVIVVDGSEVRDAPASALVDILNQANAESKSGTGFFENIPCKGFSENSVTIRNHQTGSVKEVPYANLTFLVISNRKALAAQVMQGGAIGMNCSIISQLPTATGEIPPATLKEIGRVAGALQGLGAKMGSGVTVN